MLCVYNHWETPTGIFPFDLTWQCYIPTENIAKSQFSIKTTSSKTFCSKQTELKIVSIKKESYLEPTASLKVCLYSCLKSDRPMMN